MAQARPAVISAARYEPLPLLQFIPALNPRLKSPRHLAPLDAVFERIRLRGALRVFVTLPPRHAKTETVKYAIVRLLLIDPSLRIGYGSYSAQLAEKKSREIRELYRRAGGKLAVDAFSRADWRTGVGDGGLWAQGVQGSWTGEGFDVLVIDDPIQDRAHAESGLERQKLMDWFNDVAFTRLEPDGSILVVHTRWHTDDLGGRLVRDGWEHVHMPALLPDGSALWPERFSVDQLAKIRRQIGEYAWSSLYMGQPYSRGGRLFGDVQFYGTLPESLSYVIGIDLAYSAKTRADYSTAVVLAVENRATIGDPPVYVVDVLRLQVEAPRFIERLATLRARYPGATVHWYVGGTEKGIADVMKGLGLDVETKPAIVDKHARAQPVAAAWNAGRVLLPRSAGAIYRDLGEPDASETVEWLNDFVTEIVAFTGVRDVHDDQIDALAAGFDASIRPGWLRAADASLRRQAEHDAGIVNVRDRAAERGREIMRRNGMVFCPVCSQNYIGGCTKHPVEAA